MNGFLFFFVLVVKCYSTDVPTGISAFGPSEYHPFHPELLKPPGAPPLDLLREPDVGYVQNQGIKNFKKSLQLETIVRNPVVVLMPNVVGPKYSAYFLTGGFDSTFRGKPFFENAAEKVRSDTVLVFDPSVGRRLSFFPISNFTVLPIGGPEALQRSTRVPWLAFENVKVSPKHSIGRKTVNGRLFHFFLFGDDDWDFFPENSVFDWTRPFPFAFAPPAPTPDKEPVTESAVESTAGTIDSKTELPEKFNVSDAGP